MVSRDKCFVQVDKETKPSSSHWQLRSWKVVEYERASQWEDFEQVLGGYDHKENWDQSCAAHFREGFLAQNHLTWQGSTSTGDSEGLASEKFYNVALL